MSDINSREDEVKGGNFNMYNQYCCASAECSRSFPSKEEKIKMLKEYKEQLEQEAIGVSERINELAKEQ